MNKQPYLIGVDVGTGSVRAAVFSGEGEMLGAAAASGLYSSLKEAMRDMSSVGESISPRTGLITSDRCSF
jgi:ribulose kinase